MLKKLFPAGHLLGFTASILLTLVALSVVKFDLSRQIGLAILIVTAFLQAAVQLFLFMHIGESSDKKTLYTNVIYAVLIALIIIFGSAFVMVWGYQIP